MQMKVIIFDIRINERSVTQKRLQYIGEQFD